MSNDLASEMATKRSRWAHVALIARGALFATAFWCGIYAWWIYQDDPTGVASAMYIWIRHFYGALFLSLASLLGGICTFAGHGSAAQRAGADEV